MINRTFLIISLILAIIVLASFIFLKGDTLPTITPQPPIPIEERSSPRPSTFIPATTSGTVTTFTVTAISPVQDINIDYSPITPVQIKFNTDINIETFEYTTTPNTPTILYFDDARTVRIVPKSAWEIGTTTITILKSSSSTNGSALPENYVYQITTAWPPTPPADDTSY